MKKTGNKEMGCMAAGKQGLRIDYLITIRYNIVCQSVTADRN
jgi:hypothetical protein